MDPPKIQRLSDSVVNRIAAGEVIQRPVSAVKELLENSLDAAASSVTLLIKDGGLKLIQVSDDGHGIRFEDLQRIKSMGFRGEALASMTHVGHVTVTTITKDQLHGYRVSYRDGVMEPKPCAAVKGTQIMVENLFYNMGERRKTLQNSSDDYSKIVDLVSRFAIHHINVSFSCRKHGAVRADVHTVATSSRLEAIKSVYGVSVARNLIEIEASDNDPSTSVFEMHGYMSNANYAAKKITMVLFINDRLVECSALKRAIEIVYAATLPKASKPFIYISVVLPPENVDVNVHPTKREVSLLNQEVIIEKIQSVIESRLRSSNEARTFQEHIFPWIETLRVEYIVTVVDKTFAQLKLDDRNKSGIKYHCSSSQMPDVVELQFLDTEDGNYNGVCTTKKLKQRKRKHYIVDEDGQVGAQEKLAKSVPLSLSRPSYVLGLVPKPLRVEHRARLRYLLRRLVNQHQWAAASGVLSVYLKGTLNDTSPFRNRLKFWALLELPKHVGNLSINPTRIKNLYDIWSKNIGSMKTWPVRSRYAVHLEFMFFCLIQGNVGDAYQLALCLEQENVDIDPVSKMMMGLTFYELWYSSIPKEFQRINSDPIDVLENSHMEGTSFSNEIGQSERCNSVESHMADSQCPHNLDASVMNDKQLTRDVAVNEDMEVDANKIEKQPQNFQREGFYLNSEEQKELADPFSNSRGLTQDMLHGLGGLDLWLLPLHFSKENTFEELVYLQKNQPNDYYKSAVKYLRLALNSEPSASAALLPLIQLLLIGGQVGEALIILEKQCCNSASLLPIRVRAALLERFDQNNSLVLVRCYEHILKKDPTCGDTLAKLIKMHQNGNYSLESLLEMVALHLDATDAEYITWKEFSSCFLRLCSDEEDCMSSFPIQNEDGHRKHCSVTKTPKIFTDGVSGKSWRLWCRWWLTRHFSSTKLQSDIEAGDLQFLTYKAACASYMYGRLFSYVVKAYSHLAKENDEELLLFLDGHRGNSMGIYQNLHII